MDGTAYPSFVVPNRPRVASQYSPYAASNARRLVAVAGTASAPNTSTSAVAKTPHGSAWLARPIIDPIRGMFVFTLKSSLFAIATAVSTSRIPPLSAKATSGKSRAKA